MNHRNVTVSLVENSTTGNDQRIFPNQIVDIEHDGDIVEIGIDGHRSVGRVPHIVVWHGAFVRQLAQSTGISIALNDGTQLLDGALCRTYNAPINTEEGVRFEVLLPE